MVVPIDPSREITYIDDVDRKGGTQEGEPLPGATVWRLRPPTMPQRQAIADGSYAMDMGGGSDEATGRRRFLALQGSVNLGRVRSALRPPEQYAVPWSDEPCRYDPSRRVATLGFLSTIPDSVLGRLAARAAKLTDLDEAQVGKSEPQSMPRTGADAGTPAAPAGS